MMGYQRIFHQTFWSCNFDERQEMAIVCLKIMRASHLHDSVIAAAPDFIYPSR